ncbi:MAG: DUF4175 family protein [Candidatus Zixiibacteriota bacterium]
MASIKSTSELIKRLHAVLVRQRLILFVAGLLATIAALAVVFVFLALVAYVWVLPVWFKVSLLTLSAVTVAWLAYGYAIKRMFDGSVDSVALALESANPELKGRLIAAVQFARMKLPAGYSSELIKAVESQVLQKSAHVDFNQVVTFQSLLRTGRNFAVTALVVLGLLAVAPGFFGYALEVYSNPTTRIAPPVAYQLMAVPGSTEWIKYRDITVGGVLLGERFPEKASLHHRLAGGSWQKTEFDIKSLTSTATAVGDSVAFNLTLRQADRSFDYYVQAGDLRSEVYRVDVVDRSRLTGISLSIFYPDYTGLSPLTIDENNGSFSAVVGSRVNIKIETNLPVATAEMVFEDSSRQPLSVEGRSGTTSLRVDKSLGYHIELTDHLGEKNPDPIEYYVTAVPDQYPTVDVLRPGFDVNLNDDMLLPLKVRIFDDYGFSSLVMKYQLFSGGNGSEEHVAVLNFSDRIKTEGDIEFNWDMDVLGMFPGDYVAYYFEVADNDRISGPKIGRSRRYIARLPSLDEIIAETEQESERRIANVEDLVRSGRELSRRLQEAARKLESQGATNQTSDWQQQKELETIAQQNSDLTTQVEKLAEQMEKALDRIEENSLMSREIIEKLREIQKLFEEVATPEMREAQQKLMEMMRSMDPEQLQQAMKDFQMSQEELLQRLERTLTLLKRMQVQAKMEAMIRQAEELLRKQDKVNDDTEKASDEAMPGLSKAEQENADALDALRQEAEEFRELLKEAQLEQSQEAQKFAEAVEQTDADQSMNEMTGALKNKQKPKASNSGKQSSSRLLKMLDQMRQMQMAMNQDDTEEIKKRMRKAIDHSNNLSLDQEDQIRGAQEIVPGSVVIRDMAGSQHDLAEASAGLHQTITELGKLSPFVAAELRGLVSSAIQNMEMATAEFSEKRGPEGVRYQTEAMSDLNRATTRLMESLDQLNQCQSGANCDKGMAKMESLCNKQNQLNQATQGMCNSPGQGGPPSQSAQGEEFRRGLERLAAEQGSIRKSLEQLDQEFGASRQILGRLSDIAEEMKEVEESLESGDVGPETSERQLRVYSRMLEAARSLQRKDFTEQRQATSATERPILIPRDLPQGLLDERINIEDRLRRFLGDNYPPQYEEQIKAYFRALLKAESEQNQSVGGGSR